VPSADRVIVSEVVLLGSVEWHWRCLWARIVGSGGLLPLPAVESAGDSLLDLDSGM